MPAMMEIIDVQSRAELDRLLPEWLAAPAVALDTEFFRERSYFPVAGLIQLSIGGPVYLIDPIAIGRRGKLRRSHPGTAVPGAAGQGAALRQRGPGSVPAGAGRGRRFAAGTAG